MANRIRVEASVPAEPERVYAAWTSAEGLARWWWPHVSDTVYEVEAHRGGHYDIRSAAHGIGVQGEFVKLDPPRAIRMTWRWMDEGVSDPEEEVLVTFAAADGGTRVTVQHDAGEVAGAREGIREGWESVLGRLATAFDAN